MRTCAPYAVAHEQESTIRRRRSTSLRRSSLHSSPLDRRGMSAGTSSRPQTDSSPPTRPRPADAVPRRRCVKRLRQRRRGQVPKDLAPVTNVDFLHRHCTPEVLPRPCLHAIDLFGFGLSCTGEPFVHGGVKRSASRACGNRAVEANNHCNSISNSKGL